MTTRDLTAGRAREATAITVVLAVSCGLACAGSVVPGLDHAVTTALLTLGGLAFTLLALGWVVRWVRERVEDRADARTAVIWRAHHAPHLLTAADQAGRAVALSTASHTASCGWGWS